jgi:hypothetical protein
MPMRDTLHRLVDALPESELAVAERFLNYLRATADPVLRALLEAPLDDEPETELELSAGRGRAGWDYQVVKLSGRPE